jgi:hypothetical protein
MSRKKKPLVNKLKKKVSQVLPSNQKRQGQRKEEPLPMSNTSMDAGNSQGETHPPKGNKRVRQILSYLGESLVSSTFWTAAFTGLLVYFTCLLYQVSNRSDQTTRGIQRAFVTVQSVNLGVREVDPAGKTVTALQVFARWENSGTTPAKRVRTHISCKWHTDPLPQHFDFPDEGDVLGPKTVVSIPCLIPIEAVAAAQRKQKHLYMWGWTTYQDIFDGSPLHLFLY